jgi:purine-nucleoside phosphorylase
MTPAFAEFASAARAAPLRAAVILGSGLGAVADGCEVLASVGYADIPAMAPPTVAGHRGRLDLVLWGNHPVLVAQGRVHIYEGHSVERVTRLVRLFAELRCPMLILTNAAGGIHPSLNPGGIMVIDRHWKLLGPDDWKSLDRPTRIYSPDGLELLRHLSPTPHFGGYAALTGPCYETPAEIRALAACGADAVGMSTAVEAEAAAALGVEVLAFSCITNKAAGLSADALSHTEVEANAKLGIAGMRRLIGVALG